MPSATKPAAQASKQDDLDNYLVGNLSDDPFASPSPESSQKKRKANDGGLGIDEEVNVQKRARAPAVKLDEDRLLSEAGIPTLRKRAQKLKIKGKGHEFSDAARLLSFYQMWLDDLFPKAKFLDALKMVEKAGHKKKLVAARNEWMNERKPKADDDDAEEQAPPADTGSEPYVDLDTFGVNLPQRPGPGRLIQGNASSERPGTPQQDDFSEDDELYNVTPRARPAPRLISRAEEPEEDELDALMAETEGEDGSKAKQLSRTNGAHEDEGDDLDALIAEAEGQDGAPRQKQQATNNGREVFEDEEAAMREMDGLW